MSTRAAPSTSAAARLGGEVLYTFFPDKTFRGPTYDFLQLKVRASRSFEALTFGALAAWTPEASYRSGTAWRVAMDATVSLHAALKASATAGRRWVEIGVDRTFWDAGVTGTWKKLSLDLRYVDTNLDERECGFTRRCNATIVATLTLTILVTVSGSFASAAAFRRSTATASPCRS